MSINNIKGLPIRKAMILAAGLGTRLKPWTDNHPKALAMVKGKSLLQRNIEYLQQYGIYDVIVNVHHLPEEIIETIEAKRAWGSNITISDERDEVLETGGGLKKASWYFTTEEQFLLINGDVLTDLPLNEMITFHSQNKPLATLATTNRNTSRYLLFDDEENLCGWRNVETGQEKGPASNFDDNKKKSLKQKAFSGIHIISSEILHLIKREGKFSMIDLYLDLCSDHSIKSFDHSQSKFIDVGKPESLAIAEMMF